MDQLPSVGKMAKVRETTNGHSFLPFPFARLSGRLSGPTGQNFSPAPRRQMRRAPGGDVNFTAESRPIHYGMLAQSKINLAFSDRKSIMVRYPRVK